MLNIGQFRARVVRPVLETIGLHSMAAENLLLGTAAQESNFRHLVQLGGGPALGLYQMEPATHDDIWENYLAFRGERAAKVEGFLVLDQDRTEQLVWNLAYATAMCRIHYLRVPSPLPAPDDVQGLGRYWKEFYNTSQGRGTVDEFVENFETHILHGV
ncbi:MAG: hypothetical protein MI806_00645 [Minwuiales bacterium]|nr:hypothetical protein [Minwuiales bacterium]